MILRKARYERMMRHSAGCRLSSYKLLVHHRLHLRNAPRRLHMEKLSTPAGEDSVHPLQQPHRRQRHIKLSWDSMDFVCRRRKLWQHPLTVPPQIISRPYK